MYGEAVPATTRAVSVLARNPSPMTLEGTNTWLLAEPGASRAVVVDPGPDDPDHRSAVLAAAEVRGVRVALVLLTHGHLDHSAGAASLAAAAGGVPVRALDPAHRTGDEGLAEGDLVTVDALAVRVLATPGHTSDSLSFIVDADSAVLTGDTVLGRGTTVVAHPDGRLDDYLASLERLRDLGSLTLLPGHGPVLPDLAAAASAYLTHRQARLDQVRAALEAGDRTPEEVVVRVYADIDRVLWPAATLSVRAQLDYLAGG